MAKNPSAKKKRTIIIVAVLAVIVVAGVLYATLKPDEKLSVETVKVTKETINETLDTTGTISASEEETFTLPSGVKILSVDVKEGDRVTAGQVIATFDTASLEESLNNKKAAYQKAQAAYETAVSNSGQSGTKTAELEKQIAKLESEIAALEAESNTTTAANAQTTTAKKQDSVKISDSLVKRFIRIAKLFGVEYSEDMARTILTNMLSSGSSSSDISTMLDNLSSISSMSGSFDMSAFSGMTESSSLLSAKASLIELKAQLAMTELQSDETYVSSFKTIAQKTKESYETALQQVNEMKNGWIAAKNGIVSEVNITTDGQVETNNAQSVDISSVLSAVTSGGDFSSLLSSFLNSGTSAVKILYYPFYADISLSKYDVTDVALNQNVVVKTANGQLLDGTVSYISAVASSSSGINISSIMGSSTGSSTTIPAQIKIDGTDSSLIVGVDVNVSIITNTKENTIVVPVEAICIDNEEVFVYALEDGKAVKKDVELGISNDTYYEVISGVNVNDVLIKNTSGLEDGIKVEVK